MITVKFDDTKVTNEQIIEMSKVLQKIVREATKISEVFVYADSPKIKIDVAPIEVFIEMSASKIEDKDALFETIKVALEYWKSEINFEHPITITLTPVNWKFGVI